MLGVKRVPINYLRQLIFVLLMSPLTAFAQPSLLFSNKPVAMLYSAVTGKELSAAQVLYPDDRNMHDYQLSVADLKKLNAAEVIFWLGPHAEPQLAKLRQRFSNKEWVALADAEHAWLSWQGMQLMLSNLQSSDYVPSVEDVSKQLHALKVRYEKALSALTEEKFLLGHAAFQPYFSEIGLNGGLIYSQGHSHGHHEMGEKERLKAQQLIASGEVVCAIEEPDLHFDHLNKRFPGLRLIRLEPMATSFELSPASFMAFNEYNLQQLLACLKG